MPHPRKTITRGIDPIVDREFTNAQTRQSARSLAVLMKVLEQHPEIKAQYEAELKASPWLANLKVPVQYSEAIAQYILLKVSEGLSLRSVCAEDGMPDVSSFLAWTRNNEVLAQQYAHACLLKAQVWADEIMDISDDSSNDYIEREDKDGRMQTVFDGENMKRTQLRVDTRKWYLSKIMPKQFGEAQMLKLADAEGRVLPMQAPTLNIIGISPPRREHEEE